MAAKKYLNYDVLTYYDGKIKALIDSKDATTLASAKSYADGLASNYDAAGTANTLVTNLANGAVKDNTDAIAILNGNATTDGSVAKSIADAKTQISVDVAAAKKAGDDAQADVDALEPRVTALEGDVGELESLNTTSKTDLVSAINEVRTAVSAGGTAAAITIDTTTTTAGYLKSYTIKQGNNTVGTIDIPKDMVVESGEVVTNPEGQPAGTYIKMVLANVAEPLYVNVGTLVDIYKAKASATQVQVAVDSATREISATIVAGSIGATELAANAVTTEKIADTNVTKAKLSTAVQASLDKADSAVQSVATGSANGTIAVDDTDVAVKGLGSAAYTESSAYATAAQGSKADSAVQSVTTGTTNGTISVDGTAVAVYGLGSAAYTNSDAYDAAGAANAVDTKLTAEVTRATNAEVANTNRIVALENLVGDGFVAITTDEVDALFV